MWVELFWSIQQEGSRDYTTTQLPHTNTISSARSILAALYTVVQRLQFTLDMGTQAPSLELLHENVKVGRYGGSILVIPFGMVTILRYTCIPPGSGV